MPMLSQPAFGPKLSIGFITGGALLDVWTLVWRYTIKSGVALDETQHFWYLGLLLTGMTFLIIGAFLGSIGRAARKAELPPEGHATRAEEHIQANAAANPAGVAMVPGMVPGTAMPAGAMMPPAVAAPPAYPPQGTPGVVR